MKRVKPILRLLLIAASFALASCTISAPTINPNSSQGQTSTSQNASGGQGSSSQEAQSPVSTPAPDSHWNLDFNQYGLEFAKTLGTQIIASGGTTSYSNCLSAGAKAAAFPNESSSTFIPFYHNHTDANKTTTGSCNREHTWPNSRGGNQFENDPIMVRPTLNKDNSSRGNNFYGTGSKEWDPASCGYEGARGESARIILYCATAYNSKCSLSNNPSDSTSKKTMGTLKTLLKWNREYAPTDFEKTVNERYDRLGYRRNPFVDHPEYANWIWDDNGFRTTPYGGGGITPTSTTSTSVDTSSWYDQVKDFSDLDGKSFSIVAKNSGSYYSLTTDLANEERPWYITGDPVSYTDGKMKGDKEPVWFTFEVNDDDSLTITAPNGDRLFGYVAGTHYSIGFASDINEIAAAQGGTSISSFSDKWSMESVSNGTFQLVASSVYLEYYRSSFQGYNSAPSDPLMLFAPND